MSSRFDDLERRLDVLSSRLDTHISATVKNSLGTDRRALEQDVLLQRLIYAVASMTHNNNMQVTLLSSAMAHLLDVLQIDDDEEIDMDDAAADLLNRSIAAAQHFRALALENIDDADEEEVINIFGFLEAEDVDDEDDEDEDDNLFDDDGEDEDFPDLEEGGDLHKAAAALAAIVENSQPAVKATVKLKDIPGDTVEERIDTLTREMVGLNMQLFEGGYFDQHDMESMNALLTDDVEALTAAGYDDLPGPGPIADEFRSATYNGEDEFEIMIKDKQDMKELIIAQFSYQVVNAGGIDHLMGMDTFDMVKTGEAPDGA